MIMLNIVLKLRALVRRSVFQRLAIVLCPLVLAQYASAQLIDVVANGSVFCKGDPMEFQASSIVGAPLPPKSRWIVYDATNRTEHPESRAKIIQASKGVPFQFDLPPGNDPIHLQVYITTDPSGAGAVFTPISNKITIVSNERFVKTSSRSDTIVVFRILPIAIKYNETDDYQPLDICLPNPLGSNGVELKLTSPSRDYSSLLTNFSSSYEWIQHGSATLRNRTSRTATLINAEEGAGSIVLERTLTADEFLPPSNTCRIRSYQVAIKKATDPVFVTKRPDETTRRVWTQPTLNVNINDWCEGPNSIEFSILPTSIGLRSGVPPSRASPATGTVQWYKGGTLIAGEGGTLYTAVDAAVGDSFHVDFLPSSITHLSDGGGTSSAFCRFATNSSHGTVVRSSTHNIFASQSPSNSLIRIWDQSSLDNVVWKTSNIPKELCALSDLGAGPITFNVDKTSLKGSQNFAGLSYRYERTSAPLTGAYSAYGVGPPSFSYSGSDVAANIVVGYNPKLQTRVAVAVAVGFCTGKETGYHLRSFSDNIFRGTPSSDTLARVWEGMKTYLAVTSNDLCVASKSRYTTTFPSATVTHLGSAPNVEVEWYRNGAPVGNKTLGYTLDTPVDGDFVFLKTVVRDNTACVLNSDTSYIRSNTHSTFATRPPDRNNVRIWDTYVPTIKASTFDICPIASSEATIDIDYSAIGGDATAKALGYSIRISTASPATSNVVASDITAGSALSSYALKQATVAGVARPHTFEYALTVPPTLGAACGERKDAITIRDNTDTYFQTKDPDAKVVRYWANTKINIEASRNSLSSYIFCDGDAVDISIVSGSLTGIGGFAWKKKNASGVSDLPIRTTALSIRLRDLAPGDTVFAVSTSTPCTIISDSIIVTGFNPTITPDATHIQISPRPSSSAARFTATPTDICADGSVLTLRVSDRNYTNYRWMYKRNGRIADVAPSGTTHYASITTGLEHGDSLWAELQSPTVGCQQYTDTIIILSNSDPYFTTAGNSPSSSIVRIYSDNDLVSIVSNQPSLCKDRSLDVRARVSNFGTNLSYTWYRKKVVGPQVQSPLLGGTATLTNHSYPNLSPGEEFWFTVKNGTNCEINSDTIVLTSSASSSIGTKKGIRFYHSVTGDLDASKATLCRDDYAAFNLTNLVGEATTAQWLKKSSVGSEVVLATKSLNITSYRGKGFVDGDTVYVLLENSSGCKGYSNQVVIDASPSAGNTKRHVLLYPEIKAKANAKEDEYCTGTVVEIGLSDITGNPTIYEWFDNGSGRGSLNRPSALRTRVTDASRMWAVMTNVAGCVGRSDTVEFFSDISQLSTRTTTKPYVEKAQRASIKESTSAKTEFCSGDQVTVELFADAGYAIDNTTVRWYLSSAGQGSTKLLPATGLVMNFKIGEDIKAGDEFYATFKNARTSCDGESNTITITTGGVSSAAQWKVIVPPSVEALGTEKFCGGELLRVHAKILNNTGSSSPALRQEWYKQGVGEAVPKIVNTKTNADIGDVKNGDGIWYEMTTTDGCLTTSDTIHVVNDVSDRPSGAAPSKYPLIYDNITGTVTTFGFKYSYCEDDPVVLYVPVLSLSGDAENYIWRRKRAGTLTYLTAYSLDNSYTSVNGSLLVGDTVWAELRNSTGCLGESPRVAIVSSGSGISPSASNLVIYDVITGNARASVTNVCPGGDAVMSISSIVGGPISSYQWKLLRNSQVSDLSTTSSFTHTNIQEGDKLWCKITNTAGCEGATDTVEFSAAHHASPSTKNVWYRDYVSSLLADKTGICVGESVTLELRFTGTTPIIGRYEWNRGTGATSSIVASSARYTSSDLVDGDAVWCVFEDDAGCSYTTNKVSVSNMQASSPTNIQIYDLNNVEIRSNATKVCTSTPVRYLIATAIDNSIPVAYQWYRQLNDGTTITFAGQTTNAVTLRDIPTGNKIWCEIKQPTATTACRTIYTDTIHLVSNTATSAYSKKVVIYDDVEVNTVARVNGNIVNSFCENDVVQLSYRPVNPAHILRGTFWRRNASTLQTEIAPTYTISDLKDGDVIDAQVFLAAPLPTCAFYTTPLTVKREQNISMPMAAGELRFFDFWKARITASKNEFCAGTDMIFDLTNVPNSSPIVSYRWILNGSPVDPTPSVSNNSYSSTSLKHGDSLWCELYNELDCVAYSDTVIISRVPSTDPQYILIYDLQTSNLLHKRSICVGDKVEFSLAEEISRNITSYSWKMNEGAQTSTTSTYSTAALSDGDKVWCIFSEGGCAAVSSDTVLVISSTSNTPQRGGIIIYDDIKAKVIYAQQIICSDKSLGMSLSNISAGVSAYTWYRKELGGTAVAGVSNTPTSLSSFKEGEIIYAELQHGSLGCRGHSDTLMVVVNRPATNVNQISVYDDPDYAIEFTGLKEVSSNEFCEGVPVTFTAKQQTPRVANNSFQWLKNGKAVGGNSSIYKDASLVSKDTISCEVTNSSCIVKLSAISVVSDPVTNFASTIRVRTINKDIIRSSSDIVCGSFPITFTVENVGVGTFSYNWIKNGSSVGSHTSYKDASLIVNDAISMKVTNEIGCTQASDTVRIMAGRSPAKNEIRVAAPGDIQVFIETDKTNVFCLIGHAVTFKVINIEEASINSYSWTKNGIVVSTDPIYTDKTLTYGDQISVRLILSSGCDVVSNTLLAVQGTPKDNEFELRPFNVEADVYTLTKELCATSSVAFLLKGVSANTYSYRWHINDKVVSQKDILITKDLSLGDYVWCEIVSDLQCAFPSDSVQIVDQVVSSEDHIKQVDCQITTGEVPSTLIPGDVIDVAFNAKLTDVLRNKNKKYIVQLSNEEGDFENPYNLATQVLLSLTGSIKTKIPEGIMSGCKYRIRVIIGGLNVNTYIDNGEDIVIASNSDLDNMLFSYSPNEYDLEQGKGGQSTPALVDKRGCKVSFRFTDETDISHLYMDALTGVISWTSDILFADRQIGVHMITPFDRLGYSFITNYKLKAKMVEYNIKIFPNPVSSNVMRVGFQLTQISDVKITLINEAGEFVGIPYEKAQRTVGTYIEFIDISNLSSGNYILLLDVNGDKVARQFIVLH